MTVILDDLVAEEVGFVTGNWLLIRTKNNRRWFSVKATSHTTVQVSLTVGHSNHRRYCRRIECLPSTLYQLAADVFGLLEETNDMAQALVVAERKCSSNGMPTWIRGYHQ